MKLLSLLACIALTGAADGRFEETLEQCKERYGKATAVEGVISGYRFEKNGITIRAHFGSGLKCDFIMFTREKPFTDEEAKLLAEASGRSRTLTPIEKRGTDGAWIGSSGTGVGKKQDFVAILTKRRTVFVASAEDGLQWWKAFDEADAKKEAVIPKDMDGF